MPASRQICAGGVSKTLLAFLLVVAAFWGDAANAAKAAASRKPAAKADGPLQGFVSVTWDGEPTGQPPVNISLTGKPGHLQISVTAPYFGDKGPICKASCFGLWNYEVVQVYFLGKPAVPGQPLPYMQIDLSPQGSYHVLLLEAVGEWGRNISRDLPLKYESQSSIEGKGPGTWSGTAQVPISYFPTNVEKWNAFAMHNDPKSKTGDGRAYWSMSAAPKGKHPKPNNHRLQYFIPIIGTFADLLPGYKPTVVSDVWKKALATKPAAGK